MKQFKGFTLIEMVVVIIIIGIMAAVAMPKFFNFTSDAEEAVTQAKQASLTAALQNLQAQWAMMNQPEQLDYAGNQYNMNSGGYPIGIVRDGVSLNRSSAACASIANSLTESNDFIAQEAYDNLSAEERTRYRFTVQYRPPATPEEQNNSTDSTP